MLKISGAVGFAGTVPAGASAEILDTSAKENGDVHRTSGGFVEIGIKVPNVENARLGESCTFDRGFRIGNGGIYSGFPQQYLGLNTDSIIVANHHGLQSVESENTFVDGYIPMNAPSRGGGVFAKGHLDWNPQLKITSESVELSFGERTVRIPAKTSKTESVQVSGEYISESGNRRSLETTAKITVSHHGQKPFYIHDTQMLIPKESEMGRFIAKTVPEAADTQQVRIRPDSAKGRGGGAQAITISNQETIRSVPAYGMRIDAAENGGAN